MDEVAEETHIDPWFLREIQQIVELEAELGCWDLQSVPTELLLEAKISGLTNPDLPALLGEASESRRIRTRQHEGTSNKRVDTCARGVSGPDPLSVFDLWLGGRDPARGQVER